MNQEVFHNGEPPISCSKDIRLLTDFSGLTYFLQQSALNVSDIDALSQAIFWGAYPRHELIGLVGLECDSEAVLLQSLCVIQSRQHQKTGRALVKAAEGYARVSAISQRFLLTTSATAF